MTNDDGNEEKKVATGPQPQLEAGKPPFAWQPLTPRGVAAFATATFGRVLLVQLIVALLAASTMGWFLWTEWFPTVRAAIKQLPDTGSIAGQELNSPRTSTEPLAESRFLGFVVNVANDSNTPSRADLRVEFHKRNLQLCSLFGCVILNYPKGHVWQFNRPELEPLWGAWEPILLGIAFLGVVALLLTNWSVLATLYFLFVRTFAYFKDRQLTLGGSWRLAAAALMPGALLFTLGIFLYGFGVFDLLSLGFAALLHFVVAWVYLIVSPLALPRSAAAPPVTANPFAAPPASPNS